MAGFFTNTQISKHPLNIQVMKRIVIFILLFFPLLAFSQIGGEAEVYLTGDRVEAQFNGGGIEKFSDFVHGQFNYSKVKNEITKLFDVNGVATKFIQNGAYNLIRVGDPINIIYGYKWAGVNSALLL